jgi:hypothetical protein
MEVHYSRVRPTLVPSLFVPRDFYGGDRIWTLATGVRMSVGTVHDRAGRYGAALPRF